MTVFAEAFTLWGSPVTWLEIAAFLLSLAMVWCNLRVHHWGWPFGMAASALYGALFAHSKLYAEAALQVFFIAVSVWGWLQWLSAAPGTQRVRRMSMRHMLLAGLAGLLLTAAVALVLMQFTDSDRPWTDAAPSALSVLGQVLLGKKYLENWAVWLLVNALSVGLFASKGLWLTTLLYAIFVLLSCWGWRQWRALIDGQNSQTGA